MTGDYGWKAVDDLDGLIAAGNLASSGIWSDGTTVWVTDWDDDKIYAYNTDGTRDSSRDFNTLAAAGNRNPRGIWSDRDTMWVAESISDKIYAYRMSDKERDASKDFDSLVAAGNRDPRGIWSDRDTMWVADEADSKVYAYKMSDKTRDASRDFKHVRDGHRIRQPRRHLVRRRHHVGGQSVPQKALRLQPEHQGPRCQQGLQHAQRGGQQQARRHLVRRRHRVGGRCSSRKRQGLFLQHAPEQRRHAQRAHGQPPRTSSASTRPDGLRVGVASTETRATITATASDSNASVAYSPADADTSTTIHDVDLSAGRTS